MHLPNEDAEECEECGRVPTHICEECGCCIRCCECGEEEEEESESMELKVERVIFEKTDRIVGERPFHIHRNPDPAAKVKEWACNSPYCEDLLGPHPDDGGFEPVVQGREPWRGGMR